MKRQSLHVKDNAIYDQFTKQQVNRKWLILVVENTCVT